MSAAHARAFLTVRTLEEAIAELPAQQQAEWRWAPKALEIIIAPLRAAPTDPVVLDNVAKEFFGFLFKLDYSSFYAIAHAAIETKVERLREAVVQKAGAFPDPVVAAVASWMLETLIPLINVGIQAVREQGQALFEDLESSDIEQVIRGALGNVARGYVATMVMIDALERDQLDIFAPLAITGFEQLFRGPLESLEPPYAEESRRARRERMLGYARMAAGSKDDAQRELLVKLCGVHLRFGPDDMPSIFWMPIELLVSRLRRLTRDDGPKLQIILRWLRHHARSNVSDVDIACAYAEALRLAGSAEEAEVEAVRALAVARGTTPSCRHWPDVFENLAHAGFVEETKHLVAELRVRLREEDQERVSAIAVQMGVRFGELDWLEQVVPRGPVLQFLDEHKLTDGWAKQQRALEQLLRGRVVMVAIALVEDPEDQHVDLVLDYFTNVSHEALDALYEEVWTQLPMDAVDQRHVLIELHPAMIPIAQETP